MTSMVLIITILYAEGNIRLGYSSTISGRSDVEVRPIEAGKDSKDLENVHMVGG